MPLTVAAANELGKCTVPNGDCASEPVAEEGVIEPEGGPDIFGVEKVSAGGI
jgi:hypothetical protein